jgi:hypothetical protein
VTLADKGTEIERLIAAFEVEAAKFRPLSLSLVYVTQESASVDRLFAKPNHTIMLWQYYGMIGAAEDSDRLAKNVVESDLMWGLRGAEFSCFAVLEGEGCELFVRMAQRAGTLFDESEANTLSNLVLGDILRSAQARADNTKPTVATNSNPLAVWLNFLLFHLSLTNAGRERAMRIEPDPFSLSLLALESLRKNRDLRRTDRRSGDLERRRFKVGLSFPGKHRAYVSSVADALRPDLPLGAVFYDFDFQAELARPNLDLVLLDIYKNRCDLVVVFIGAAYGQSEWCGLEWRAVREMIKQKHDDQLMMIRFDDADVEGLLSIDGYVDARRYAPSEVASLIKQRVGD